jgi:hypothetical protein
MSLSPIVKQLERHKETYDKKQSDELVQENVQLKERISLLEAQNSMLQNHSRYRQVYETQLVVAANKTCSLKMHIQTFQKRHQSPANAEELDAIIYQLESLESALLH